MLALNMHTQIRQHVLIGDWCVCINIIIKDKVMNWRRYRKMLRGERESRSLERQYKCSKISKMKTINKNIFNQW